LEDALGNRMTRDAAGQPVTTTRPAGGTRLTTIAYDALDLIEVQDPLDRVTEFFPDTTSYTYEAVDAEDRWASGSPGTASRWRS
jgi:YD repeat-containing protein